MYSRLRRRQVDYYFDRLVGPKHRCSLTAAGRIRADCWWGLPKGRAANAPRRALLAWVRWLLTTILCTWGWMRGSEGICVPDEGGVCWAFFLEELGWVCQTENFTLRAGCTAFGSSQVQVLPAEKALCASLPNLMARASRNQIRLSSVHLKEGVISWEQNREEQVTNAALPDTAFDRVTLRSAVAN